MEKYLFKHPEGQAHPRPPTHLKKLSRYDFGESLHGQSAIFIKKFLEKDCIELVPKNNSIADVLRDYIYSNKNRSKYVKAANEYLKNKKVSMKKHYDLVLIGAGIHSALFLYTLKKSCPDLKVLVLEGTSEICSTFHHLGDSLVLNSPTFTKVGLNANVFQEHFIQVSDFDELKEKPFPTAKHLYQMAVMVFMHSDADILFNFSVKDINKDRAKYSISNNKNKVIGKKVIIANGMGSRPEFSYQKDKLSSQVIFGDDFLSDSYHDETFFKSIQGKRIAVVGAGDTANCVMEYLLPLVYPNHYYGFKRDDTFLPQFVYWFGQNSQNIQDYFFANKSRYCHSGGIIEFFWDEETPFELSTDIWRRTKELIESIPQKLKSLTHFSEGIRLETEEQSYVVDLVIDCTGRSNSLSQDYLQKGYEFIEGDIRLFGGQWSDELDRFIVEPRSIKNVKIACQVKNEEIYFIGSACPLANLIDDDEAKNGSLKYQEERTSLTNSKWSLEHTLPRTISFAKTFD